MKTNNQLFAVMLTLLLFNVSTILAQDEPQGPQYITVTTMHWNMDYEDFDMDTWKAVEKEYLDQVTEKNDYVAGASFYLHQMTPSNTEIVYVRAYNNWEDIEKAAEEDGKLAEAAWPDEESRKAYFKKRRAYYSNFHSDEIYSTLPLAKPVAEDNTKDLICYVRTTHLAFPEDGDMDEIKGLMSENFEIFVKNNPLIKGYYPNRHAWGSDSTEMLEAFFFDSMADLEEMFDGFSEIAEKAWPDEEVRKARDKKFGKYFTGEHGDAVYKLVAELSK